MALRDPLEKAKPGGEGARGKEKALGFIPLKCHAWPPSFRSIGHALPPSLLLHTLIKHWSAHIQARGLKHCPLLSWGPGPVSASGPSLWRSMMSDLKGLLNSKSVCEKRLTVGNFQPTRSPMKLFYRHKHNVILTMTSVCFWFWFWCTVCTQHSQTGQMLTKRGEKKKTGSTASNYTDLIGGSVHGLGQGRTGNTRPQAVGTATWCRCTADRLHQGKHADEIKAHTH